MGYEVTEEFGVCGPENEVAITTTTLSSCSAIIIFNAKTRILGLFHYPGMQLSAPGVQRAIIAMINDITPTQIVLWPANPKSHGYGMSDLDRDKKLVQLDNAKVKTFLELKKPSSCTLEVKSNETFPGVQAVGGKLVFESSSGSVKVPSSKTIQESDGGVGRVQRGNIWFYFGSGAGSGDYSSKLQTAASTILEIERGW